MAVGDSGSWKLLIYPLGIILLIALVLQLTVVPFIESGVPSPSETTFFSEGMSNIISSGNIFNITNVTIPLIFTHLTIPVPSIIDVLPTQAKNFLSEEVTAFGYLPVILQYPLGFLLLISMLYSLLIVTLYIVEIIGTIASII